MELVWAPREHVATHGAVLTIPYVIGNGFVVCIMTEQVILIRLYNVTAHQAVVDD